VIVVATIGNGHAQSLEEQTRRPPGTSSLDDDSQHLRDGDAGDAVTDDAVPNTLDNDSMDLRGRTADQAGTNSLDDGSLEGGNRPHPH
jgi:hypothetical protein